MMDQIRNLIRALYHAVGNKRYMHDIEKVLEKLGELDLSRSEKESLQFLAIDLERLQNDCDRYQRQAKQPWLR